MFQSLEIINPQKHANLTYKSVPGYAHARKLTSAPLSASEMPAAARHFPILFPRAGRLVPVALFGLQRDASLFVDDKGGWMADYVPAHIRRYPFILGQTGEEHRFVVMIDRAAPHFASGEGEALFADGQVVAGGVLERAKTFLGRYQGELERTEKLVQPLEEHGVLIERQFTMSRGGKNEIAVQGFRQVDETRVAALSDAVLGQWVRSGLMAIVISHLHALSNAQRMVQRLKAHA